MPRRQWFDYPDLTTPLSASLLNDLEARKPEIDQMELNVADYGLVGDGLVDDTNAFLDAYADLPVAGSGYRAGGLVIPANLNGHPVECNISSTIDLDDAGGVTIRGHGGSSGYPRLVWTGGAGSGSMISVNSGIAVTLDSLLLGYNNGAYNGDLITTSGPGIDPSAITIDNCWIGGLDGAMGAACLVLLDEVIHSRIAGCLLNGAVIGIKKGPTYATTISIRDNMFANFTGSAIKNPGDVWRINDNVFEPKGDGSACGIDHDLNYWTNTLSLIGNYFADVTAGAGTWVKLRAADGLIASNYMQTPGPGAGSTHFYLDGCFDTAFIGNRLNGGDRGYSFWAPVFYNTNLSITGGSNSAATPYHQAGNAEQLFVITAGGIRRSEGKASEKQGVATLVAGTVTVTSSAVTTSSRIMLSGQNSSGTHGELTVSARTAATSFTITSSNAADTRLVAWVINEPA